MGIKFVTNFDNIPLQRMWLVNVPRPGGWRGRRGSPRSRGWSPCAPSTRPQRYSQSYIRRTEILPPLDKKFDKKLKKKDGLKCYDPDFHW